MDRPPVVEPRLKHSGTGRSSLVLRVESFERTRPFTVPDGRYVLVIASERPSVGCTHQHARAWIDAGASYICAWGPGSGHLEDVFDYASFLPELGEPVPFTLMTTSHKKKSLDDALWFAFYNAMPASDLPCELNAVVVVVDSAVLEKDCVAWIRDNKE